MPTRKHLVFVPLFPLLAAAATGQQATGEPTFVLDADTQLSVREGFDAELLYTVPKEQGSWVAMAFDGKGRLIVSDQDGPNVFRLTLPAPGDAKATVGVEPLPGFPYEPTKWGKRMVGGALGLLCAFDSLYLSSMKGLYRIRDTDGDDTYDEFTRLAPLTMGYEHSAHCMIVTEDGKGLYLVSGNHAPVPAGVRSLQPPVWDWDATPAPMPDPQGHAVGVLPPGGWVCRISPDGKDWTMVASGLRNAVDLAIDRHGELFTCDSDMEFDIGSPWYRPTRVNHVTSASEFGWRAGSAKWPDDFADGNGAVIDIGPGSPTGLSFGHRARFPDRWRDTLFVADWTFGTVYAVDLAEHGSSYTATKQVFLSGAPLNIAALRFGPDGHMYFVVGGRTTASKLYRVRWTGAPPEGAPPRAPTNQALRDLRRSLAAWHGNPQGGAAAVDAAWPHLSHDDREIRYAARLAIENQDLALWQERVFTEPSARAAIHGVIAMCRHADRSLCQRVLDKLGTIPFDTLPRDDALALLRAYSLCLLRLGPATPAAAAAVAARLDPFYPAKDERLDAELCRVLGQLDAATVVAKTIALMQATATKALAYDTELLARHEYGKAILAAMANTPNSQNIHYANVLRRVQSGWTLAHRKDYFTWLRDTLQKSGGLSFAGYMRAIRQDAIAHLPPDQVTAIAWLLGDVAAVDMASLPLPRGPAGGWTLATALPLFADGLAGRDPENGKQMFAAGRCIVCHRFGGSGGYSGPDLGSVGKRFSVADIVTAICEPSQAISEQYQASKILLKEGGVLYGRIIDRTAKELAVAANPYDFGILTRMPLDHVETVEPSPVSMMPPATVAMMNEDELRDLVAWLVSGGDRKHAVFQPRAQAPASRPAGR